MIMDIPVSITSRLGAISASQSFTHILINIMNYLICPLTARDILCILEGRRAYGKCGFHKQIKFRGKSSSYIDQLLQPSVDSCGTG